jgi:hypothetical protein
MSAGGYGWSLEEGRGGIGKIGIGTTGEGCDSGGGFEQFGFRGDVVLRGAGTEAIIVLLVIGILVVTFRMVIAATLGRSAATGHEDAGCRRTCNQNRQQNDADPYDVG